ncbi:MAG: gluconate 2-dehydrogenase subunit 3 family protein [Arenicellales bacterium]
MTTRRAFFRYLTVLFTGMAGIAGCSREDENPAHTSSNTDGNLLNAFVDTIVPEDQDPGAVEAGIPDQLLAHFIKEPEAGERAQAMLKAIDGIALSIFQSPFMQLALKQREMVLDIMLKNNEEKHKSARTTLLRLRARIIKAFYSSPTAWEMLAYSAPYPAGYPDFNMPPPGA